MPLMHPPSVPPSLLIDLHNKEPVKQRCGETWTLWRQSAHENGDIQRKRISPPPFVFFRMGEAGRG